ncbi:MAG: DUF934 domain-containing protein [Pseudomonadales bacterium]|nr:DUF934 domain-containing protein [Pseudomonadales bacterium]
MPAIIKNQAIVESDYQWVDGEIDLSTNNLLLPLTTYIAHQDKLSARKDVGIWLEAGENIEDAEAFVSKLPIVALNFPAFGDGRAYSSANILRRKFGFEGELRAIGDVRRDQLEQMVRCGFDSFQMADGQNLEKSLAGLNSFTYNYQGSIDRPEPLFQNR